jgi:hypothetical protein
MLNRGTIGTILIDSVSLSPLYLILLLILHPRTNSKKRLCGLCVETDTKTEQSTDQHKQTTPLFNTAIIS